MGCTTRLIEVAGRKVELIIGGAGKPLLFLEAQHFLPDILEGDVFVRAIKAQNR
jgi:hypothetical protein